MSKRLLILIAALAAVALAAGAVPAFTADSGTINVTVTALPTEACVEFATGPTDPGTQVNFGALHFSSGSQAPPIGVGDVAPRFSNCGSAAETLLIAGDDAHNVCVVITCLPHTWSLMDSNGNPCPVPDRYLLAYAKGSSLGGVEWNLISKTNVPLIFTDVTTAYAPNEGHVLLLGIGMPCAGSVGGGETFRFPVTLTAELA